MRSDWKIKEKPHRENPQCCRWRNAILGPMILAIMIFVSHTNCRKHSVKTEGDIFLGHIVSFSRIGIAGNYTHDYLNVWEISEEENAEQRFIEMIEEPRLDRKLYALMGLKIISSHRYDIYKNNLLNVQTSVQYGGGGCLIPYIPVSEVVKRIDRDQLRDPR